MATSRQTTPRFGLLIHQSLAAVPAWAPVGEDADWYRAHAFGPARDTLHHDAPLAESLAHHRDRWAHVEAYDDFAAFLTYDEFDASRWATMAQAAGMDHLVAVAKHHDGWCWWNAPHSDRNVVASGPRRDVIGELSDAAVGAGLGFGAQYSLLEWGDERDPAAYVEEVLHPQVLDLVERYPVDILHGDGHWGAGASHWRSEELIAKARGARADLLVDDRWWIEQPDIHTFDRRVPQACLAGRWEVRRPLGTSYGHNRAEPPDRLLTARQVIALLTEVLAKGGGLLLGVGADASGRPSEQAEQTLREVGRWLAVHPDVLTADPWTDWGDAGSRYLAAGDRLLAIDIDGTGRFPGLRRASGRVLTVTDAHGASVDHDQNDEALELLRHGGAPRSTLPQVVHVRWEAPPDPPIELFSVPEPEPIALQDVVAGSRSGAIVQLGDATYVGPATIPAGVTVRGLGPARSRLDAAGGCAVELGDGSRLEHCSIRGGAARIAWLPGVVARITGRDATMIGCAIDGHVDVSGDRARIVSSSLSGVVANGADRCTISRSALTGIGWDTAIAISGGHGHLVEGCELSGSLRAIHLTDTVGSTIRGNRISARWGAIRLVDTEATRVNANAIDSTMRAVDVEGGALSRIVGNAVADGDSGCVVRDGATDIEVSGNHWTNCRIGLLLWQAVSPRHHDNGCVDLYEEAVVVGP